MHNLSDSTNSLGDAIALASVDKCYQEAGGVRQVLKNLSLTVGCGEFISVMGPSGSGKSTLLNILGGVDTADSGEVKVGGVELSGLSEAQRTLFRRHHIGFIFQFFNLIPTLSVEENLCLPLALCKRQYDMALISSWLERFKLESRRNAYPGVLSGGEQQRVAVVRAAIHRPRLILADEPTGNLDTEAGAEVLQLLREVTAEGTSIIMATHSQTAASTTDRKLRLEDGGLLESG